VCSQFANAMAALAGVCPQEERAALLRRIIDPASLGPVPLGEDSLKPERDRLPGRPLVPVGTLFAGHWLCRALFECGLDAEALAQMRLLWLPYRDSVTLPETRRQHGNTGFCHGWAGGPAFLLPRYALGLRIEAPRRAVFAPCPGDLTQASGAIPHGPEAHWRRQADGSLHWQLTIPQGWRVRIPGAADASDLAGPWRGTGALPAPSPAP